MYVCMYVLYIIHKDAILLDQYILALPVQPLLM